MTINELRLFSLHTSILYPVPNLQHVMVPLNHNRGLSNHQLIAHRDDDQDHTTCHPVASFPMFLPISDFK